MNENNLFKNTFIEFHILQSFPVTCLNRDDVGAPKTAIIGGVQRARVSSQCWKRQVRLALHEQGIKLAIRSKKIGNLISKSCIELGASEEIGKLWGESIANSLAEDTLLFFTESEALEFAKYAHEQNFNEEILVDKKFRKNLEKISNKIRKLKYDGLDIALFGRMVAAAVDMNVEAASCFSHAISTHKVSNEVEFFTALDDLREEPGSAHIGSLEFNSSTYYRYVSLNLGQLVENLDDQDIEDAVDAFIKALFVAVPSARQTTQSGASPWEHAIVYLRKGQRLQVPFETAIKSQEGGYLQPSIEFLKTYLTKKESLFGSLFGKIAKYTYGEDDNYSIDHLINDIKLNIKSIQNG